MRVVGKILALAFVVESMIYEHGKHDLPTATLLMVWAVFVHLSSLSASK